ncbi:hypothetical protein PGTUg99_030358 [Puccinia graminis f. sp. tritici]|uniref:Uncharacterized protein n=1 Tax=Puccinia graminis f. sp. tritici TaxID=56615 RepID=A0A5B0RP05_PUCGR|nr:hypothetical protein PGTUg99_030358 [Puccinia graminis f. sp. tritici]
MEPIDKLSAICPKCFGPPVPGKKENEPDFIVCMDGNFQHRRHLAASSGIPEQNKTFTLFIDPDEVLQMESTMRGNIQPDEVNDNLDRCTEQHTAANDVRGPTTWKACDDTGIFGMACRHDQSLFPNDHD